MEDFARLQALLRPGEQVLWWGRPDAGMWFTGADLFLIPFGILWCVFSIGGVVGGGPGVAVFTIPFTAIGLYLSVGRLFYKHSRKKQTIYGITTQRALVSVSARASISTPWPLRPAAIRRSRDGTHASVILKNTEMSPWVLGPHGFHREGSALGNTGLEYFGKPETRPQLAFYDVADATAMLAVLDQVWGRSAVAD